MLENFSQIAVAVSVFVSTNIDDVFLLAAFFTDRSIKTRSIIIGQCLGIGALVLASCIVAWFSIALPDGTTSLFGLIPLYLGIRSLPSLWTKTAATDEDQTFQYQEKSIEKSIGSQILAISGVTIANGGDNLGVYIPLFASTPLFLPLYVTVFAVMTLLWCLLGFLIVNNPIFGEHIRRYGHKILPIVLILLGIDILSGVGRLFA